MRPSPVAARPSSSSSSLHAPARPSALACRPPSLLAAWSGGGCGGSTGRIRPPAASSAAAGTIAGATAATAAASRAAAPAPAAAPAAARRRPSSIAAHAWPEGQASEVYGGGGGGGGASAAASEAAAASVSSSAAVATAQLVVVTAVAPLDAAAAYDDDEAAALTRAIKRARTWRDVGKLYQRRVRQHQQQQQQQQQLEAGASAPAPATSAATAAALNPVHSSAMLAHLAQLAQQAERREERQTADASPELWDAAAVSLPLGAAAALAAAAAAAAASNGNAASVWRDSLDDPSGSASSGDDSLGSSGGSSGDEAETGQQQQQQQQQQQPSRPPLSAKALRSRRSRLVASLTALSAQHLPDYDARGASNALWALVSLGAPPPRAWLASFCAATLPLLQQHSGGGGGGEGDDGALFDAQALATSAWALARARHRPPEAWMQAWQRAVADELFVEEKEQEEMGRAAQRARALGTALWACPALGLGEDTAWFQRALASLARRLDTATDAAQAAAADQEQAASDEDNYDDGQPRRRQQPPRLDQVAANVLWACVRLGQRPPDALWRALARHLRLVGGRQGAGARSAAGILWAQASLAAADTAAPSSDADAVAKLLLHDPAAPERLKRAGARELATLAWATGALCRRSLLLPPGPWRSSLLAAFLARLGERKQRSDVAGRQLVALLTGVSWWCATADDDAKAARLPEGWLAAVLLDDEQPSASSAAAAALLPRLSTPALAALLSALARLARTGAPEHRVPAAWAARAAAEVQRRGYGAGSSPASLAALARAVAALSASSSAAALCGPEWTAGLLAASQPRLHAMPAAHLSSLATAVLALSARPNGPWVGAWAAAMAARADEGAETAADLSLGARVLAQLASSSFPSSSPELMALHANAERVAVAALEATAAAFELAEGATLPARALASLVWSASALLPRPAPARAAAATARLLKAAHPGDLVTGLPSPHSAALLLKGAAALGSPPPPMLRALLLSRARREWSSSSSSSSSPPSSSSSSLSSSSSSSSSSARDLADLALGLAHLPKPPQKDVLAVCERAADLAAEGAASSDFDGDNGHNAVTAHAVVSVALKALAEAGLYCSAPRRSNDLGQVHRAARARAFVHRLLHAGAEALPLLRAGELAALAAALARARCVPPPAWQQRFAAATGARLASGAASPRELAALLEALASMSGIGARCGPAAIGGGGASAAAAPDVCAVADAAAASARQLLLASTSPRQEQQQESGPRSAAAAVAATMMLPLPRAWLLRAAAEASSRARSGAWTPDDLARGMWGIGTLLLVAASSAVVAAAELPSERGSSSKSGSGSSSGSSTPADAAVAGPAAAAAASPVDSGRLRRDSPGASSSSSASAATAAEVADALSRRLEQAVAAVVARGSEQQGSAWWLLVLEAMAALRTVARNGDPPPLPAAAASPAASRRPRAGDSAEAPPAWLQEWVAEARRAGLGAADGNNARRAAVAVRLLGGRPPREWLLLPGAAATPAPVLYVPSPSPLQPRRPWSPAPRGDGSSSGGSSGGSFASSSSARREAVATAVAVAAAAAATAAASVAATASSPAEQADERQDGGSGGGATATAIGLSPRPARRVTAAAAAA